MPISSSLASMGRVIAVVIEEVVGDDEAALFVEHLAQLLQGHGQCSPS